MPEITSGGRRPEFELRVDGSPAPPRLAHDVIEIDVTEAVNRHGRCTLLLQNWDVDRRDVRWSDSTVLAPGVQLELLLGYGRPADNPVPPGLIGHASLPAKAYDPEKARQTLKQAGPTNASLYIART